MGIRVSDRIILRDRPWIVRSATKAEGDRWLLKLEELDGDDPRDIDVAVPPEDFRPMPSETPAFELSQLDSLSAWTNAHRILAATLIRKTGAISGAHYGRVALEAYQLSPTLRLLSKPRASLLIADDVGLGKTIEAGLALLELMARGRVERVLVVVPPGLMEQWRQELLDKFGLEFRIVGNASDLAEAQETLPAGVSPWDALPWVITSIDYLKKDTVRSRALRRFAVAEHSAQLSGEERARRETDFKEGKLDAMVCTPTLELGVDIGPLLTVVMRNAPPLPPITPSV